MGLNDEQVVAILTESLSRGLYESLNNTLPPDPAQRMKDATDLVQIAEAAFRNGNKSENVEVILSIAKNSVESNLPAEAIKNVLPAQSAPKEEASPVQGFDITQVTDGVLEGLIIGLDKFPNNENVENERKAYIAEKERRGNASQPAGQAVAEEPQGEAAQEANTNPSGAPGDSADGAVQPEDGGEGGESGAQGEDAGAFARAQTPETSEQGKPTKAKKAQEDGERAELIEKLTLSVIKAHNVDLTKIDDLSGSDLMYMIANPDGPPQKEEAKMPVSEKEIEENSVPSDVKGISVRGLSAESAPVERVITKADLGLEVEEDISPGGVSAERENIESLITGPTLKAFGRGRKEIPSIGDNELRFMILNSDGKVTPEELEKAKALDGQNNPNSEIVQKVENVAENFPIPGQQEIVTAVNPPVVEVQSTPVEAEQIPVKHSISAPTQIVTQSGTETVVSEEEVIPSDKVQQQNRAMEIINKEHFPIPKDFDGEPPAFPNDISKVSDDELFSFHAIYYACESRANWILSQYEDELLDIEKLRMYREAIVANSVPLLGEDGRRNTNEFRDAKVNADIEVLKLGKKENEINKIVKKLKVLRDNYRTSVSVCSRQYSMRSEEYKDIPK